MTREEEMYGLGERKACFGYPATKQKTYKYLCGCMRSVLYTAMSSHMWVHEVCVVHCYELPHVGA